MSPKPGPCSAWLLLKSELLLINKGKTARAPMSVRCDRVPHDPRTPALDREGVTARVDSRRGQARRRPFRLRHVRRDAAMRHRSGNHGEPTHDTFPVGPGPPGGAAGPAAGGRPPASDSNSAGSKKT